MKKLNIVIRILFVLLICAGTYKLFFHEINEEFEVLNKDVSLNNIKSVIEVQVDEDENVEEIPLGYKNDKIYILKYTYDDMEHKTGKYDKTIYSIDENGISEATDMNIPEDYCTGSSLNIYGNYIFCRGSYYDWITGEKTIIFSDEGEYETSPVSGNKDYILYKKNNTEESEYYLVNIKNKGSYEYKISNEPDKMLEDVFFDKDTSEFYGINNNYNIVKLNMSDSSFSTELYDNEVKLNYSNEDTDKDSIGDRYIYSDNGKVYFGSSKIGEGVNEVFDIDGYYLRDKYIEDIDSINVCGYDKYNSDCLLVKKKDDTSEKMYFVKFKNNNMDTLMEIPKAYGNDSITKIRMSDDANLLISESYHDSDNKKIKNKYTVYDLKEYFTDNEYVLNNDGTWTGKENDTADLLNAYKNIDDSQRGNKQVSSDKKEDIPKAAATENIEPVNKQTNDVQQKNTEKTNQSDDFREHDPSWKMGNGDWYYYNKDDKKVTSGWVLSNGKWYYFDENGVMQKNALVLEHGCEFYLDENGVLLDSDNSDRKYLKDKSKESTVNQEGKSKRSNSEEDNSGSHKDEDADNMRTNDKDKSEAENNTDEKNNINN